MEHETYFATAAQLLPVIALAGVLEIRHLVRSMQRSGAFTSRYRVTRYVAHVYPRLLALSTVVCLILALSCLEALYSGSALGYLHPALVYVLPIATAAIASPILVAVLAPTVLLEWYEGPVATETKDSKKKRKLHDDD